MCTLNMMPFKRLSCGVICTLRLYWLYHCHLVFHPWNCGFITIFTLVISMLSCAIYLIVFERYPLFVLRN